MGAAAFSDAAVGRGVEPVFAVLTVGLGAGEPPRTEPGHTAQLRHRRECVLAHQRHRYAQPAAVGDSQGASCVVKTLQKKKVNLESLDPDAPRSAVERGGFRNDQLAVRHFLFDFTGKFQETLINEKAPCQYPMRCFWNASKYKNGRNGFWCQVCSGTRLQKEALSTSLTIDLSLSPCHSSFETRCTCDHVRVVISCRKYAILWIICGPVAAYS